MVSTCEYCKKEFSRKPSQLLKYKKSYCSKQCKKLDQVGKNQKGQFETKHKNQVLDGKVLCTNCLEYKLEGDFYKASLLKHRLQREYFCKKCSKTVKKRSYLKSRPYKLKYLATKEGHLKNLLQKIKHRNKNNIPSNLTIEFLLNLYDKQEGKCSISGVDLTTISGKGRVFTNISVDRIDSSKGYTEDNIQLVCFIINLMKQELSQESFLNWIKIIYTNHG